jgi:hypothetical protein
VHRGAPVLVLQISGDRGRAGHAAERSNLGAGGLRDNEYLRLKVLTSCRRRSNMTEYHPLNFLKS